MKKGQKPKVGYKKIDRNVYPEKFDPYNVIKYPLNTEKSIRLMESENKMLFVVDRKASKADIKKAIELLFKAKVVSVNTMISLADTKKAFIKFKPETPAIDIATNLGLM